MNELNIYGDISGGTIFDMMDRYAHSLANQWLKESVTANASINYLKPLHKDTPHFCKNFLTSVYPDTYNPTKVTITTLLEVGNNDTIATASFLFIAKKTGNQQ